ncbi:MAG: TAXI family TRAP transporter solute-binding subunit, partial [Candidatus Parabeggiatoa sp.]|nr:TAXI family TRAP transporter solute-binding subunit [Candidatus Parabeggiatoa sp.]
LSKDWAYNIVKQVGNYGEVFDRNVGKDSPLKMERGLNALWNKGGIMSAPPIQSLKISVAASNDKYTNTNPIVPSRNHEIKTNTKPIVPAINDESQNEIKEPVVTTDFKTESNKSIKIGAGGSDGEYTKTIAPTIIEELNQKGFSAEAVISAGSQENIDKIFSGERFVGLTQLDVAALNMANTGERLILLGGKIAPEALFCAVRQNGKVANYADLTKNPKKGKIKISIGKKNSGTERTFQYLITLDPKLKKEHFTFFHDDTESELSRLNAGRRDIVCFVLNPNTENALIKQVADNDDLFFIEINNPLFDKAKVKTFDVYDILDVPFATKSKWIYWTETKTVKTLVTWVHLVGNDKKLSKELRSSLIRVANKKDLLPDNSIAGKAKRMICNLLPESVRKPSCE